MLSLLRPLIRWFALVAAPSLLVLGAAGARARAQDPVPPDATLAAPTPVAARRLPRGTVLTAGDIVVDSLSARVAAGENVHVAPGWVTRRVIRAGEVLRAPAVAPAPLVHAGDRVVYVYSMHDIELVISAVAMSSAALGDEIMVRLGDRRRVSGVVTAAGRIVAHDPRNAS